MSRSIDAGAGTGAGADAGADAGVGVNSGVGAGAGAGTGLLPPPQLASNSAMANSEDRGSGFMIMLPRAQVAPVEIARQQLFCALGPLDCPV